MSDMSGQKHFYSAPFNILQGYKLQKSPESLQFLLFLFCLVLEILCYLNKVVDRVPISFLCSQRYWLSYPTKKPTISAIVEYLLEYILNSIYIVLQDLYTCPSQVSMPKTQFVGLLYQIYFLGYLLTDTTNYKLFLSQQTPKNFSLFCSVKLLVLSHLLLTYFFYAYALTHLPKFI